MKKRVKQYGIVGLVLVVFGGAWAAYCGCSQEPKTVVATLPKDQGEDMRLSQIHHVASRDGIKEWALDAESVQYQKTENRTVLKHLSATFFLKDSRRIHLTSRDGILLTETKDLEVSGDVVVRSGPYELNADRLHYDHENRSISTDGPVVMKGRGIDLTGKGLVFSLHTERALIKHDVEALFKDVRLL
ncbi:MAG: LPS export ABC transporter periplasmic protein LptC [Thermodesulfobacteriota bacterium]|nr:LPS export ABC transporter periplasmic protein LptC [Thermodesulfobacteriota bacterium]